MCLVGGCRDLSFDRLEKLETAGGYVVDLVEESNDAMGLGCNQQ